MMERQLSSSVSAISRALDKLSESIVSQKVYIDKNVAHFVFLCGANKPNTEPSEISERRAAIQEFGRRHLPNTRFILAEKVFEYLVKSHGEYKNNLLDLERNFSFISDHIIIILESNSSFSELGAFAYPLELRKKLIIINDKKFQHAPSFVNMGPIKAIKERWEDVDPILLYNMRHDGINQRDAIGDTFHDLQSLLSPKKKKRTLEKFSLSDLDPTQESSKAIVSFIHDIIYLCGPLTYGESIEILKRMFGDKSFDNMKHIVALLRALELINPDNAKYLTSTSKTTVFTYPLRLQNHIIATFKNHILKYDPKRIAVA